MTDALSNFDDENSIPIRRNVHIIKTYSFNNDDSDNTSVDKFGNVSNRDKLLSMNSPSVESTNTENNQSDTSSTSRKKSRQRTDTQTKIGNKRPFVKKRSWYKKLFYLSKPLQFIGILIFFYFMWIKRDVWISRFLTTNGRIPHSSIKNAESSINEVENSLEKSSTTIKSKDISDKEDTIENTMDNDNKLDKIKKMNIDNYDASTSDSEKLNLRTRRNKMNFNIERQKRKHHHLHSSSIHDNENEPIYRKDSTITLPNYDHRSNNENQAFKHSRSINDNVRLSSYTNVIDKLRKNLKSRSRNRNFKSTILKTTGMNKNQLNRFIYKRNYQSLKLETFLSLLDAFNLIMLVVPK